MSQLLALSPELRDDLEVTPALDHSVTLRCPITGRALELSPRAADVAQRLDGARDLQTLHTEVSLTPQAVVQVVHALAEQLFIETPDARAYLRRYGAARRSQFGVAPLRPVDTVEVDPDLAWSCQSCGACCSGRFRVELTERDRARLAALPLEEKLGRTLEESTESVVLEGVTRHFLVHASGRCVFLEDDMRCGLHRHLGYRSKPVSCRNFPFYPIQTPRGGLIQYRPECSSQHRVWRTGPPVAEQAVVLWGELIDELDHVLELETPLRLNAEQALSYEAVQALEEHALQALETAGLAGYFAAWGVTGASDDSVAALTELSDALARVWDDALSDPRREHLALTVASMGWERGRLPGGLQAARPWPEEGELAEHLCAFVRGATRSKLLCWAENVEAGVCLLGLVVHLAWQCTAEEGRVVALNEALILAYLALFNQEHARAALWCEGEAGLRVLLQRLASGAP